MKQLNLNKVKLLGKTAAAVIVLATLMVACKKDGHPYVPGKPHGVEATVVSGSGDVSAQLAQFRSLLGDTLNTNLPGNPAGRREVNWDGVPANLTDPFAFPADFFNPTDPAIAAGRKRGLLYATNDSSFRVSNRSFIDIDSSYATQFTPFSAPRVFARLGSNVSEVVFRVPGTTTPASIKGFGVIFVDVDDSQSTFIEFYEGNKSLGSYKAPVRTTTNFSFLGVFFPNQKITRLKITSGNGVLQKGVKDVSNGGTKDLVVMDDFFYSEPAQL